MTSGDRHRKTCRRWDEPWDAHHLTFSCYLRQHFFKGRQSPAWFLESLAAAREAIFAVHLAKRKRKPKAFDLAALARAAEGFSGAEIEQAIVSAMYTAFAAQRDLDTACLLNELRSTRPLSVLMAEKVESLRAWARDRCVRAD